MLQPSIVPSFDVFAASADKSRIIGSSSRWWGILEVHSILESFLSAPGINITEADACDNDNIGGSHVATVAERDYPR
jgi:hypothetical protein